MQVLVSCLHVRDSAPIILPRSPLKCRPFPFSKEPLLTEVMHSLMPSHAHGIGVVQRNDDPRVLFPELLMKSSAGHPRLFGHRRDLIRGKDLGLLRGDPGKLLAD